MKFKIMSISSNYEYSTLTLIKYLRKELQKFPEILAKLFPERTKRYTDTMLSILWRGETLRNEYIKNARRQFKCCKFVFPDKSLSLLMNKLANTYGEMVKHCFKIFECYKEGKLCTLGFIDKLKTELGKLSGDIFVTDEELSLLFGRSPWYITNKIKIITKSTDPNYNPNYTFSYKNLEDFKWNIEQILGDKAKNLKEQVIKYLYYNPDLKDYSLQQYTIKNPNYFSHLGECKDDIEKFYWLGFLYADGHLEEKRHKIQFKLSIQDEDKIYRFAQSIGFSLDRIHRVYEITEQKGQYKTYISSRLWFGCKPMADALRDLGFTKFKEYKAGLPEIIKSMILSTRSISKTSYIPWYAVIEGKFALAFLLGFYDGDGTYHGGMSASICNTNKKFLTELKIYFGIKNRILKSGISEENHKQLFKLALGPDIFKLMLESFKFSMKRKRP